MFLINSIQMKGKNMKCENCGFEIGKKNICIRCGAKRGTSLEDFIEEEILDESEEISDESEEILDESEEILDESEEISDHNVEEEKEEQDDIIYTTYDIVNAKPTFLERIHDNLVSLINIFKRKKKLEILKICALPIFLSVMTATIFIVENFDLPETEMKLNTIEFTIPEGYEQIIDDELETITLVSDTSYIKLEYIKRSFPEIKEDLQYGKSIDTLIYPTGHYYELINDDERFIVYEYESNSLYGGIIRIDFDSCIAYSAINVEDEDALYKILIDYVRAF